MSPSILQPPIRDVPSVLAHPISWRPPNNGITLVELFGDIETYLAAVLENILCNKLSLNITGIYIKK